MKDNLLDGEYLITKDYTDWLVKTGGYAKDMTLRDHFAGLAMQACLAQESILKDPEPAFKWSYKMADAMLKERSK